MAYVDIETLKRNIRVNFMPNVDIDGTVTVENAERYFINLIEKTSTEDVVEVKHGEYKDDCCTVCGMAIPTDDRYDAIFEDEVHYCYYCGAKMDGKSPKRNDGRELKE